MRLNSGAWIIVLPAALACLGVVVWRLEGDHIAPPRAAAFPVHRNPISTVHARNERLSLPPTSVANVRFTHLTVADGLSQSELRAIVQDRQGFMWFGTWLGGLNRYDGYTFKVYKHDDQDDRSLGCNSVWALYVDRAGVLWVGTVAGLDRYDQDTDSFVHYRHRADDPASLPGYDVRSIVEDESGALWVATSLGLGRFDRTTGRFRTYRGKPDDLASFGDADIRSLCLDRTTGLLWLSSWDKGVSALDRSTGHFTRYQNNPRDSASLSSGAVQFIYQDREGTLWFSTLRGLDRFDPKIHAFIHYRHDPSNPASLSDDYVTATYEDRAGRFWVATNNGLNLMDWGGGTFTRYLRDPNDPSSLGSNVISWGALYEDASGALWIGTRSSGVDRLAAGAERFTTYRHSLQGANSPGNNVITALTVDTAGVLWIGSEAGLDRFDGKTFTHYITDPSKPSGLSPGPERSVVQDSHGAIWTGTYGGGLDRLVGHEVRHFRHDPQHSDSLANNNISSLVPDANGGLWVGVHGKGLDYFDGRHFTHFAPDPADPHALPTSYVRPMLMDRKGTLWICSWRLIRFDTHTRQFKSYPMDPNQPDSRALWNEDVYSDGAVIWVASPVGLHRFDPEAGKFTRHYTEKDGLPSNIVMGVVGDAQGNLWVSTARGLSRFDPRTETFRNYDVFDGLQGNEFSLRCRAKAPDGRLFIGGVNGLSAFYPERLIDNPTPPPVVLTEFELFNKPPTIGGQDSPLRQAINVASRITLRYDQSVFRFQFAALDYTAPQKNRYAYKLEGFDRDWQYTDASRRLATYTNLDPGDYTFHVRASNNDGIWNEHSAAVHLTILPPWWKTNWFRAACVAVFAVLAWIVYRVRIRELEEREKKFREAVETMPAMAFLASSENERTFVNKGWVEYTGLTLKQASGSGWHAAVHPDDLERVLDKWGTAMATGEALDYEVRLRHVVDGEYRWFHTRVVPLRDNHGRIVKWCGIATDIEDRKRAEEEHERLKSLEADLRHLNRVSMMGELAASIAHEVNQPLAAVISNGSACLRWLARDVPDLEEAREAARRIVRDGKRGGEIIARIRALATKRAALQKEELDLNAMIREVLALVGDEAKKNIVMIRTQFADNLSPVSGDRVQLQQVVLNLVMNAIEAMGSVRDRARELLITTGNFDTDQAQVGVEDSGTGLDIDAIPRIFDSFYSTKPGGMGMGLSISRSIIEAHGGKLWATARDGPGASFHFTLPAYRQESDAARAGI